MLLLGLMVLSIHGHCQEPLTDTDILAAHVESKTTEEQSSNISFLQSRSDRFIARYNPFTLTFGGMMFVYQRMLSPQLAPECLYHPSCSSYSKQLIREYGLVKGAVASADRLMRCNRVAVFDIHPMHLDEQTKKAVESIELYQKENP